MAEKELDLNADLVVTLVEHHMVHVSSIRLGNDRFVSNHVVLAWHLW